VDVDAVAHRAGDAVAISPPHERSAFALLSNRASLPAGARVRREHQLEARWKDSSLRSTRDHDVAALERLAQRVEDVGRELGRLVEEQHAAVRE
jgi:hypothetical protein